MILHACPFQAFLGMRRAYAPESLANANPQSYLDRHGETTTTPSWISEATSEFDVAPANEARW